MKKIETEKHRTILVYTQASDRHSDNQKKGNGRRQIIDDSAIEEKNTTLNYTKNTSYRIKISYKTQKIFNHMIIKICLNE